MSKRRILVVGSGGREHALVWALRRSPSAPDVIAAPGNPGIAELASCVTLDAADPQAIAHCADDLDVDLVVIGPEVPLVAGAADAVRARGRLAFGPGADGARLEGSKAWMKHVLSEAGVPTARHAAFGPGDDERALAFLGSFPAPYVVKTDGLAAGKGVVVTESLPEARDAVRAYLSGAAFGDAGRTLVIEEGLSGPELSLLVVCNGDPETARPLAPAQDFKRIGDGDSGPNTGGMGAYSPVPIVSETTVDDVMARAVRPTLRWLARQGVDYRGVLYAGMMLTPDGPKVIEYNVRFGDPEGQVVLPRLTSDLAELVHAAAAGDELEVTFSADACVTVVLAAEGYPASPRTGDEISGVDAAADVNCVTIFHAGTARSPDGRLLTAGGRVLDVTATGADIAEARARAYDAAARVSWPGMQYRHDIAAGSSGVTELGGGSEHPR
ncbi:MAG: phosphoribosylamine--glycine ligase [Acidimicrobiia bacterium]